MYFMRDVDYVADIIQIHASTITKEIHGTFSAVSVR